MSSRPEQGTPSEGLFHDIRSPGAFANHPLVGLSMFILGVLVFGLLAYSLVTHGPLLMWDVSTSDSLHARALASPGWVVGVMIAGYYVGDQLIAVIGIVLGIYFLRKQYWQELAMLVSGFGGSGLLFLLLSHTFHRSRPVFESQIWRVQVNPGFPSGHAIGVLASYGLLAYFFVPKCPSRLGRAAVSAGASLIVLYVAYSRLFLGHHYLTDLVAGFAVGLACSGLAYTAVELAFRKKSRSGAKVARLPRNQQRSLEG
jgi:membrane-associated phospholipid phosphatase